MEVLLIIGGTKQVVIITNIGQTKTWSLAKSKVVIGRNIRGHLKSLYCQTLYSFVLKAVSVFPRDLRYSTNKNEPGPNNNRNALDRITS